MPDLIEIDDLDDEVMGDDGGEEAECGDNTPATSSSCNEKHPQGSKTPPVSTTTVLHCPVLTCFRHGQFKIGSRIEKNIWMNSVGTTV